MNHPKTCPTPPNSARPMEHPTQPYHPSITGITTKITLLHDARILAPGAPPKHQLTSKHQQAILLKPCPARTQRWLLISGIIRDINYLGTTYMYLVMGRRSLKEWRCGGAARVRDDGEKLSIVVAVHQTAAYLVAR